MHKTGAEISEKESTKAKIFMEAARLFAEKGFNGVSMRELSEQTGVSKPTIYYYFGSKEDIYIELVNAGLHYHQDMFNKLLEMDIPIKEKISKVLKIRFQQALEYPEFAKFFMSLYTSTVRLPFLDRLVEEASRRRGIMVELIRTGMEKGEFGPGTKPELAAEIFMGTLFHLILKQLRHEQVILSEQLADDIVELFFKGLNE